MKTNLRGSTSLVGDREALTSGVQSLRKEEQRNPPWGFNLSGRRYKDSNLGGSITKEGGTETSTMYRDTNSWGPTTKVGGRETPTWRYTVTIPRGSINFDGKPLQKKV